MASQRAPSAGWVDHDGSGCPVSPEAFVQVQFTMDASRAAAERANAAAGNVAEAYDGWVHHGECVDIVAYREVRA